MKVPLNIINGSATKGVRINVITVHNERSSIMIFRKPRMVKTRFVNVSTSGVATIAAIIRVSCVLLRSMVGHIMDVFISLTIIIILNELQLL